MKNQFIFKLLSSLPIILITLYFIPFLGICLILLRFFIYSNKKISTSISIALFGFLILIPKCLNIILDLMKIDINTIPYLKDVVSAELYSINFINYSKRLICVGIIFLIISFILKTIFEKVNKKLNNEIMNYINETQKKELEISKQNDMEMKIKQEKSKNTNYVKCPNCGADNILSEKIGTCKYCRRKLVNKTN